MTAQEPTEMQRVISMLERTATPFYISEATYLYIPGAVMVFNVDETLKDVWARGDYEY